MTDISDDDLADNYGPTTPAPPKTKAAGRARAAGSKPVAGPSTKPPSKAASKKAGSKPSNTIELDDDESEDAVVVEETKKRRKGSEDEAEAEVVAMSGPAKGTSKKAPARAGSTVNGAPKPNGAGKGKARADPPAVNGDAMEVDEDGAIQLDEDPPDQTAQRGAPRGGKQPPPKGKNTTSAAAAARQARENQRLRRENERLQAQIEEMRENIQQREKHNDRTKALFEELSQLRTTGSEEISNDIQARRNEEIQRSESLVQELTKQLSKQSPSTLNQSWTLHFLTREAAEDEQRALREEIARLKDTIKQHNAVVAAKDHQIAELRQEVELTKKDLNAEIERSKQLASRGMSAPSAVTPNGPKAVRGEASNLPVIKLYEDMTNVLVTKSTKEPSADLPGVDEDVVSCVYSYNNPEEDVNFSLEFILRNQFDRPESTPGKEVLPKEKLIERVKYIPKSLERERQELVERLNFFKDPFMFSRDQLPVFIKTLTDTVAGLFEADEEDGPGGEDEPIVIE